MMIRLRVPKIAQRFEVATQLKDPDQILVFTTIAKQRSIPFLDLLDLTEIDEPRLQTVLKELEKLNLIKISGRENVVKEFVTLSGAAALGAYR